MRMLDLVLLHDCCKLLVSFSVMASTANTFTSTSTTISTSAEGNSPRSYQAQQADMSWHDPPGPADIYLKCYYYYY